MSRGMPVPRVPNMILLRVELFETQLGSWGMNWGPSLVRNKVNSALRGMAAVLTSGNAPVLRKGPQLGTNIDEETIPKGKGGVRKTNNDMHLILSNSTVPLHLFKGIAVQIVDPSAYIRDRESWHVLRCDTSSAAAPEKAPTCRIS